MPLSRDHCHMIWARCPRRPMRPNHLVWVNRFPPPWRSARICHDVALAWGSVLLRLNCWHSVFWCVGLYFWIKDYLNTHHVHTQAQYRSSWPWLEHKLTERKRSGLFWALAFKPGQWAPGALRGPIGFALVTFSLTQLGMRYWPV